MRAFDKHAIETCHVPGVVLMENAGRGAADVISAIIEARAAAPKRNAEDAIAARARSFPVRHVPSPGQPATYPLHAGVVVVCGAGNNGGDGFVVARHLLARGAEVSVFLTGSSEKVTGESRINHDAYIDLGGVFTELPPGASLAPLEAALEQADFVVDAIFGTGLDRPIDGHLADVIGVLNASSCHCIALDIPSGLDADSGAPLGTVVEADDTVTFGHLKIGLLTPQGARVAGNVHVVDLGVPDRPILAQVGHVAEVIRKQTIGSFLRPRETSIHKHEAGNVLVIAGSAGKLGAAMLTARAAMRAGAGLVTICTWPEAAAALQSHLVELMTASIDPAQVTASLDAALRGRHAVAIGPGLGLDDQARAAVDHVVLGWDGLKVVDADALTHFVGRPEALAAARGSLILTPHPGELGRLLGRSARAIEGDRFGAVREAVALTGAIVVLKGARTVIATPDGRMFICMAGNPALATAGSGDVLTGMIAALACSMGPERAASAGVLIHALSGDVWRATTGSDRGLLAGEIAERVPGLMAVLASGGDPLSL
jgi:NAD(P)H-hydrate epimerase